MRINFLNYLYLLKSQNDLLLLKFLDIMEIKDYYNTNIFSSTLKKVVDQMSK